MSSDTWPGGGHRDPSRSSPTWCVRAPLAAWLRDEAARAARDFGSYRVLDVGCGVKPYYPFFAEHASEYVGVDFDNDAAELEGTIESLPVPDKSFELVLCTQVLEHAPDPAMGVAELARVVAPGGRVLASTHGVQVYHPAPEDLWRWTHTGLERLFRENGEWQSVTVRPGSGTTACVGMLLSIYVELLVHKRLHAGWLARRLISAINAAAAGIDARRADLREPGPGTLFANLHVVAEARP